MNQEHGALSRLLQHWRVRRPDPSPDFSGEVWSRIHQSSQSTPARIFPFFASFRAAVCWAVALAAFGGSAAAYAYDSLTRDDRMAAAHARTLDPFQIVAAPHTVHRHP